MLTMSRSGMLAFAASISVTSWLGDPAAARRHRTMGPGRLFRVSGSVRRGLGRRRRGRGTVRQRRPGDGQRAAADLAGHVAHRHGLLADRQWSQHLRRGHAVLSDQRARVPPARGAQRLSATGGRGRSPAWRAHRVYGGGTRAGHSTRFAGSHGSSYWIRLGAVTGLGAIALQSTVEFSLQMPGNAALCAVLCGIALHRDPRLELRDDWCGLGDTRRGTLALLAHDGATRGTGNQRRISESSGSCERPPCA